jgi:GWxTD domain-containing protein
MRDPGRLMLGAVLFTMLAGWGPLQGQQATSPDGVTQVAPTVEQPNPLKRRLSDKEKFRQQKDLGQEVKSVYRTWLEQDVKWLITDTEMQAFKHLSNDEERDTFIENFWQRRNPNPDSPDNEFRDEVYARIAYANEHFAAGKPGWMTDRGHIYIAYGKPDDIDSHPSGGEYQRPMEEGGGSTATFPFEVWHYRYIEGIGDNIDLEFVDDCQCGAYELTIDRSKKDALKHVPGAGPTLSEENGQSEKKDRFSHGGEELGLGFMSQQNENKEFDRLDLMTKMLAPPPVKFQDLMQFMSRSKILTGPPFLFDVHTDYAKVTNDTVMVPVTVQIKNSDITFNTKDGVSVGKVEIQGRVSSLTDKVIQTFGDSLSVDTPSELLPAKQKGASVYWYSLALRPGLYKVDIVIKDVNNPDHIGHDSLAVDVPRFDEDILGHSSLILADEMYRVPSKEIGSGSFVMGDTHVRPRVASGGSSVLPKFSRLQNLNFWMQVYNLGIDGKTKQNDATIQYQIANLTTNKTVLDTQEPSTKVTPNAEQLTLEKSLPLGSLEPGVYQLSVKVNDHVNHQQTAELAKFAVE